MTPLVLWGTTGQAIVLAEFAAHAGFEIVALFDNDPAARSPIAGLEVGIGAESLAAARTSLPPGVQGVVAIGGEHGAARLAIAAVFEANEIRLATVIHPAAYVARDASLAPGAQVLAGAVVGARAAIGRCAIINTRAGVDHECAVGDGAHIGPGATLAGVVAIGDRAFVGSGATVLPRRRVGDDAIVGAGAVVVHDVPAGAVVVGNPARISRYQSERGT